MPDTRLAKKVLHGRVKGRPKGIVDRVRKIWSDVLLSDSQRLNIRRPYSVAQNKAAWKAKTVTVCTKLMPEGFYLLYYFRPEVIQCVQDAGV